MEELFRTEIVRKAQKEDTEQIISIYRQGKDAVTRNVNQISEEALRQAIMDEEVFVEIEWDCIIGFAWLTEGTEELYREQAWTYNPDEKEVIWLKYIGLYEDYRKQGYGKSMMKFFEDYYVMQGYFYIRMVLEDWDTEFGMRLEKMGYQKTITSGNNAYCFEKKLTFH